MGSIRGDLGGITATIDKFGLLAPCVGLASTILVGAVAATIHVKHWGKLGKEGQ